MDDATREQMTRELETLRAQVKGSARSDKDAALHQHIESLQELVASKPEPATHGAALAIEQQLLAWEAEHPRLVAFASRVARALEDAGL